MSPFALSRCGWAALVALGAACGSNGVAPVDDSGTPSVAAAPQGKLLIEEVYYAGAPPAAGRDHYFSDQFIRLRNVSGAPVEAGGLLIGDAFGLAGEINRGDVPDAFADDPDVVVLSNLLFPTPTPRRIPASKQRRDHRERRATRAVAVVGGDHALTVYAPERSRASFSL